MAFGRYDLRSPSRSSYEGPRSKLVCVVSFCTTCNPWTSAEKTYQNCAYCYTSDEIGMGHGGHSPAKTMLWHCVTATQLTPWATHSDPKKMSHVATPPMTPPKVPENQPWGYAATPARNNCPETHRNPVPGPQRKIPRFWIQRTPRSQGSADIPPPYSGVRLEVRVGWVGHQK